MSTIVKNIMLFNCTHFVSKEKVKVSLCSSIMPWRCVGIGGKAPYIPKLDTRMRWMSSFMLWLLYLGVKSTDAHLVGIRVGIRMVLDLLMNRNSMFLLTIGNWLSNLQPVILLTEFPQLLSSARNWTPVTQPVACHCTVDGYLVAYVNCSSMRCFGSCILLYLLVFSACSTQHSVMQTSLSGLVKHISKLWMLWRVLEMLQSMLLLQLT